MTHLYLVIDFMVSYVECFIGISVMGFIFELKEFKYKWINIKSGAFFSTVLIFFLNQFSLFSFYTTITAILVLAVCAYFLYEADFFQTLCLSSFYLLCIGSIDFFFIAIIGTVRGDQTYGATLIDMLGFDRLIFICAMKIVLISLYFIVKHIANVINKIKLSENHYIGLACVSTVGYCIIYISSEDTFFNLNKNILVNWISLVLAVAVSVMLIYIYVKYKETINENKISEMHSQLLEEKYESINQLYSQRSTEFHDFKNHLLALYELVSLDKKEKTLEYISDLTKAQERVVKKEWSGNSIIDFILDRKYNECQKHDIEFYVDGNLSELLEVRDKDICNIFGNLLDNAIEACLRIPKTEPRYIDITLKTVNNILLVDIKNSIHQKPKVKNGKLLTTKTNTLLHGLGLESVKKTVERYNGHIEHIIEDKEFEVYITLYF